MKLEQSIVLNYIHLKIGFSTFGVAIKNPHAPVVATPVSEPNVRVLKEIPGLGQRIDLAFYNIKTSLTINLPPLVLEMTGIEDF